MAELSVFFGDTGARKTTAMGDAAEYLYEATGGKPGRAIYSDGGGWKPIKGIVSAGIIQPFNIIIEPHIPQIMVRLSQGYWPAKLDPETGLRILKGKIETAEDWLPPSAEYLDKIGFYIWEGLSGTAELYMRWLRDNPNFTIGGDANSRVTILDPLSTEKDVKGNGILTFAANGKMHWNWAGQNTLDRVATFGCLPVKIVLITAHEASGNTDDDSQEPIKGPMVVGKAATGKVARNVGDCIHFEKFFKKSAGTGDNIQTTTTDVRCYFEDHPDPKLPTVSYKCKTRVAKEQVPDLKKAFPGGYFAPTDIAKFLRVSDELRGADKNSAASRKAAIDARLAQGKG